jgi:hypothetical protein
MADKYHGHMTLADGSHVPLTEDEAKAIWQSAVDAKADLAARLPTEEDCLRAMCDAKQRLRDLGWSDATYAPQGEELDIAEFGCSAVLKARRDDQRRFWVLEAGDIWPSSPVMYRRPPRTEAEP